MVMVIEMVKVMTMLVLLLILHSIMERSFLLEYEGAGHLWGFPERRTDNNWLKLH